MELEKLFGLPAHPLLVHIPVALIPLCALGAIAMVVSTTWRQRIGWIVVVLMGVAVGASQLAAGSGEALQDSLNRESQLLERHAEMGETFVWFALVFFLAVAGLMIWDAMQRRKATAETGDGGPARISGGTVRLILSIVVVLTAVGASYRVYQVGHSGAKAVWSENASAFEEPSEG